MGFGDIHGSARVDPQSPQAQAVCDDCGRWYNRVDLLKQMEWFGSALQWTGYLKCYRCIDEPQPQLKPIILPPDPVPITLPRPELFFADSNQAGFTLYQILPLTPPQTDKTTVLADLATLSGIATPGAVVDRSGAIAAANTGQQIMAANPARSWVVVFNPTEAQLQVALGAAIWGTASNLILGPNEAMLWATSQGYGAAYAGILGGVTLEAGLPFYAWEA